MLSSSSSSSSSPRKKYDVFLSFRGEDTRKNFTGHLYTALTGKEIKTFRDDSELQAGEEIAPELLKAIQESWCSVIVFSKTYAFSGWCLDELVEIVKQRNQRGHEIFPIFYDVDPSNLRKQTGKVGKAFVKHGNKDKTQSWRTALTEVANLKGWHLNNGHESEFIGDIVKKISAKLCETYPIVFDGLIGINSRLQELHLKIDIGEDGVRIIGICGMGGIGKTTLARVVYNQMSPHFEGTSFLADVREESEKRGLVSLQKQLLSQILLDESFNLFDVYQGKAIIKNRLCCRKVLLVIDDADNRRHLECLVGSRDWFGSGSRIIITTRDEHLLESYRVDDVYKPTTLDANEALDLFNLKAFGSDMVRENDFIELSKRVVDYADGLPLALEVLGSFLCGRDATQWRSAIERLKRDSHKDILDKLQISFDGLEEAEKNIFLDMACFFEGEEDTNFLITVLDACGFFPHIGIDALIKKSLIKVNIFNQLEMHDLLKEMGRKIVRQKSPNEPGKRCRLWDWKDVNDVLTNNTATESIEAICIEREKDIPLLTDALLKMKKLRLLTVTFAPLTRADLKYSYDLKYLSNELRLLDWFAYPFRSLPSSFQPDNLVALNLSYGRIEQLWEGNILLNKLKVVNLSHSEDLKKTPDFSFAPNLERLILSNCTRIEEVHPSIGVLSKLKLLNLTNCKHLRNLPIKIGMKSLEKLILSGCSSFQRFLEIDGEMKCLLQLHLDGAGIEELPSSIRYLSKLALLHLRDCSNLVSLPSSINGLKCLKTLTLSGNNFISLPATLGELPMLRRLNLLDCRMLKSLPEFLTGIEQVNISGCASLEVVEDPTTAIYKKRFGVTITGINCYKLAERNNALTFLKKHLKIHADASGFFNLLVPGSEIPEWFSHQTAETSIQENSFPWVEESGISIKIPLPPIIGNDSPWVGVAFCCVFDFAPPYDDRRWFNTHLSFIDIRIQGGRVPLKVNPDFASNSISNPILDVTGKYGYQRFKGDHLWLCYWTRNELYNSKLNGEYVCDEILECRTTYEPHIKVKKCGLQLVYEQDLEEMEQIEEHPASAKFDDHGFNGGALVKRKRNIYEEAGPSESDSAEAEERPLLKLLERILNFICGSKINSG